MPSRRIKATPASDAQPSLSRESIRLRNSTTLSRVATAIACATAEKIGPELERSLHEVGAALGVDIIAIAAVDEYGRLDTRYQWRSIGWMDPAFVLDTRAAPWWEKRHREGVEIIIDDVDALPPEADYERAFLRARETRSLAAIPCSSLDGVRAVIVVEQVRSKRRWMADELTLISAYADLVTAALERERGDIELVRRRELAEAANRAKTDFIANMSHELRTPLAAVLGYAEMLRRQVAGPLNEKQLQYIRDIEDSAVHLRSIVEDALDIALVDARNIALAVSEVSLRSAVESAVAHVEKRARSGRVAVRVGHVDGQTSVYADPRKLRQILLNLLTNAVKFTAPGGTVSVRATIHVDRYRIEVEDTGIGIAPRDHERIFDVFARVDNSIEGAGLGLALVRRLSRAHGGDVTVTSELGAGSVFRVELPRDARPFANGRPAFLGGFS
jgi:signal transduction histidine kinase